MRDFKAKNKYREIEMGYNLSVKGINVLFILSIAGMLAGLSGWILDPPFLRGFPENYYILITIAATVILGLTYIFKVLTNNLRFTLNQLKSDHC